MGLLALLLLFDLRLLVPPIQPALGVCLAIAFWPWVVRLPASQYRDRWVLFLLLIDTALFVGLCLALSAHPLATFTVLIALSSSMVTLLGWTVLAPFVAVASIGAWLAIAFGQSSLPALSFTAWFAACVLWLLCLRLAALCYRRSRRLGRSRRIAWAEAESYSQLSVRLRRYLPRPLADLVWRNPSLPLPLERIDAVVVFVDLVGFSGLAKRATSAELAQLLGRFITMSDREAAARGGVLVRVLGDAVLVVFEMTPGVVKATAIASARAFACAVLHELPLGSPGLMGRAGVAWGSVLLGDWGSERLEFTAIGEPVNEAARLQQLARPGGIATQATASCAE